MFIKILGFKKKYKFLGNEDIRFWAAYFIRTSRDFKKCISWFKKFQRSQFSTDFKALYLIFLICVLRLLWHVYWYFLKNV